MRVRPFDEEHGAPTVLVEDLGRSCVSVLLPLSLGAGWIDEQRRLLAQVRRAWPSEVHRPAPGVHEWRRRPAPRGRSPEVRGPRTAAHESRSPGFTGCRTARAPAGGARRTAVLRRPRPGGAACRRSGAA
ncbi:DUF5959 family protein [Kitasatospora sp. NPDC001540]|uniref:DUF5959 family protein n=1 Tax=Kitasatospora sp. NPDC001540 TaxID=3364014 RepID=UPI00369C0CB4